MGVPSCNKGTAVAKVVDNERGYARMCKGRGNRFLYLLFNFAIKLKLL